MTDRSDGLRSTRTVKVILGITGLLTLAAFFQLLTYAWSQQLIAVSAKWRLGLLLLGGLALFEIVAIGVLFSLKVQARDGLHSRVRDTLVKLGFVRLPILLVLILLPIVLFLQVDEAFISSLIVRIFITWFLVLAATELVLSYRPQYSWLVAATGIALLIGGAYRLALLAQEISVYPFSLGWSEASRYYYASLFFSDRIYGFKIPPSVLHPSRYLLQSIPFIFPGLPLVFHRLWQTLLWVSTTMLTGFLLARRLGPRAGVGLFALIAYVVLYLFQGPVYYHLLVMVILILWLFDARRPWRSLAIIMIASVWAGISRINWYPVPAMLGTVLYLLEVPQKDRNLVDYAKWPALWILVGTVTAFLSQIAYISWSGQPGEQFSSSLSSTLLWYRLLPNATYPTGVLLAILIASIPTLLLIWFNRDMLQRGLSWHRRLGLAATCLALLAGGLVVSVKIGGGSNLHNLDAFLVVLGVIAAHVYFGRVQDEDDTHVKVKRRETILLPLLVAFPIIFTLGQGQPLKLPSNEEVKMSLQALQELIEVGAESDQQMLFISQRHLLTFGMLPNIKLVPDYETVFLMEMAMAGNETYLSRFHQDLAELRFDWVVVDPLSIGLQGRSHSFGEENDAWVRGVSIPLLCYYKPDLTIPDTRLQMLTPREVSCDE